MKRYFMTILLLLLISCMNANAFESRNFKLLFLQGAENTSGVDLEYDLRLKEANTWYTGFKYQTNKSSKAGNLIDRDGKLAQEIDIEKFALSLMYDFPYNISIGLEYAQFTEKEKQWGYYKSGNDTLPYNYYYDMKGSKLSAKGMLTYIDRKFSTELKAIVTPQTKLDVEQNTKIFPNLTQGGYVESSSTLDTSYFLEGKIKYEVGKFFDIALIDVALEGNYEFIPYTYQSKRKVGNQYITVTEDYKEERIKYHLALYFKDDKLIRDYGITFKYGKEEVKTSDMNDVSQNVIRFGIEKWFTE